MIKYVLLLLLHVAVLTKVIIKRVLRSKNDAKIKMSLPKATNFVRFPICCTMRCQRSIIYILLSLSPLLLLLDLLLELFRVGDGVVAVAVAVIPLIKVVWQLPVIIFTQFGLRVPHIRVNKKKRSVCFHHTVLVFFSFHSMLNFLLTFFFSVSHRKWIFVCVCACVREDVRASPVVHIPPKATAIGMYNYMKIKILEWNQGKHFGPLALLFFSSLHSFTLSFHLTFIIWMQTLMSTWKRNAFATCCHCHWWVRNDKHTISMSYCQAHTNIVCGHLHIVSTCR